jgi:hypothetical protein
VVVLSRGSKASRTVVSAPQFLDDDAGAASSLDASLAMDVSLFRGSGLPRLFRSS